MLLGVQHLVWDLLEGQHTAQQLRVFHRGGTYQHRPAYTYHLIDLLYYRVIFLPYGFVNLIFAVIADNVSIRRNGDHIQLVDLPELRCLRLCRTGHTGQLVVHPEIVLQGNGSIGLGRVFHLHIFFGFYRLVKAV
ncbi:hypothetical protein FQZ97_879830 [compost metagenome]